MMRESVIKLMVQTEVHHAHVGALGHWFHARADRARLAATADRLADGVYTTLAKPVRGALWARTLAYPVTWSLDALVGTGRHRQPIGQTQAGSALGLELYNHQERVTYLREVWASVFAHPTDTGLLGVGAAVCTVPFAAVGACVGALVGVVSSIAVHLWRSPLSHWQQWAAGLGPTVGHEACLSASVAASWGMLPVSAALGSARLATASVKLGIAGAGAAVGFGVAFAQLVAAELGALVGVGTSNYAE